MAMGFSAAVSLIGDRLGRAKTALYLRSISKVGADPIVVGRPFVSNGGIIEIGNAFCLSSRPAQSHLVTSGGARIAIGDRVSISYGAAISAWLEVRIGDDTRIGPFSIIMDSDFHIVGDRSAHAEPVPVRIGKRVTIGSRVTILPGSTIGEGARVEGGSVVSGDVPAGAIVGGVPARSLIKEAASPSNGGVDMPELVMRVLGLPAVPKATDGPAEIAQWDSLGALKLLLALEETFDIALGEGDLKSAKSIDRLSQIVAAAKKDKEQEIAAAG